MARLTALAAESLPPDQAAELARVMELQAGWENLRDDPAAANAHGPGLRERQRRYDAFRSGLSGYTARHRTADLPELTLSSPERVATWCRIVRAVCRRAADGADAPTQVVAKAYRLADRIATRLKVAPADREDGPAGMAGAVRGLDAIIAWCDGLTGGRGAAAPEPAAYHPTPVVASYPGTVHQPLAVPAG